ncbi:hypothetical protein K438DRAFT_1425608, partial [Mycena galopus ATCC 62051]
KVLAVLNTLQQENINVPLFLDALCWRESDCISKSRVQYARTLLMTSEELPGILKRCDHPPCQTAGRQAQGGRHALEEFAVQCVCATVDQEMKITAPLFLSPPEELSEEHLT